MLPKFDEGAAVETDATVETDEADSELPPPLDGHLVNVAVVAAQDIETAC